MIWQSKNWRIGFFCLEIAYNCSQSATNVIPNYLKCTTMFFIFVRATGWQKETQRGTCEEWNSKISQMCLRIEEINAETLIVGKGKINRMARGGPGGAALKVTCARRPSCGDTLFMLTLCACTHWAGTRHMRRLNTEISLS